MGPPGSPGRRCPPVLSSSMANLRRRKLLCLGLRGPWPGLSCSHCTPNASRGTLRPCWVNGRSPFLQSFSPCGAFCLSRDLCWHRAMNPMRNEPLQKLSHFHEDLKVHKRVYTGSSVLECQRRLSVRRVSGYPGWQQVRTAATSQPISRGAFYVNISE